jgi:iron(III) transport system permease protein
LSTAPLLAPAPDPAVGSVQALPFVLPSGRQSRPPNAAALGMAVVVALAALLPLAFIAWIAVETGWATVAALVFRPRVGELLVNTALLELCTVPLAILLAVTLAWLTERSDLPGARLWAWLAVAPLAVPAFVHSYAWVSLAPGLHGLMGGVLVSVLAYFPFLYLPVAAQLRRLAADRPASAGRVRALRDDPLRYLHDRDRRPVPVGL